MFRKDGVAAFVQVMVRDRLRVRVRIRVRVRDRVKVRLGIGLVPLFLSLRETTLNSSLYVRHS